MTIYMPVDFHFSFNLAIGAYPFSLPICQFENSTPDDMADNQWGQIQEECCIASAQAHSKEMRNQ